MFCILTKSRESTRKHTMNPQEYYFIHTILSALCIFVQHSSNITDLKSFGDYVTNRAFLSTCVFLIHILLAWLNIALVPNNRTAFGLHMQCAARIYTLNCVHSSILCCRQNTSSEVRATCQTFCEQ